MRYPCVVDKRHCKTPVHVEIEREGTDKYGCPFPSVRIDALCNFQDSAKTIWTEEKKAVRITGTALIPGDIAPELPSLSGGSLTVFGEKRSIERGTKARNPDGTVNYCKLEVV